MSGSTFNVLAGIVSFTINSEAWDAAGSVRYRVSGTERTIVKGQSRVEGFKEMPAEGIITATLRDRGDMPVASLDTTGLQVTIQAANGKTVEGSGMGRVGEPVEVNTEEGTFEITFAGGTVTEQTV